MTRIPIEESSQRMRKAIESVVTEGERVTVSSGEQDVAVLISLEDFALLEVLEDLLDVAAANRAMREFNESGEQTIPYDVIRREAGLG